RGLAGLVLGGGQDAAADGPEPFDAVFDGFVFDGEELVQPDEVGFGLVGCFFAAEAACGFFAYAQPVQFGFDGAFVGVVRVFVAGDFVGPRRDFVTCGNDFVGGADEVAGGDGPGGV